MEEEADTERNIYVPVETVKKRKWVPTIYNLTKEYEITKQGLRRWKKEGGIIRAYYMPVQYFSLIFCFANPEHTLLPHSLHLLHNQICLKGL